MKRAMTICVVFIAVAAMCGDAFAQRYVNTAEEASRAAKASLENNRNHATSKVEWLNNVISVINLNEPAYKDVAAQNNKAIEESRGR